jgi:hypothetical protein
MAESYRKAREKLARYEQGMRRRTRGLALRSGERRAVLMLGRKAYRAMRHARPGERTARAAALAARAVRRGMRFSVAASVVEAACAELGDELSGYGARRLRSLAREAVGKVEVDGPRNEEVTMKEAKNRPKRRRGTLSSRALLAHETPLEKLARKRALERLAQALAPHQPVVKRVVARRLLDHAGYDELAEESGLSREEVADILGQMRPWVHRYTCYFKDDWYWVEGARIEVMPLPREKEAS